MGGTRRPGGVVPPTRRRYAGSRLDGLGMSDNDYVQVTYLWTAL